VLKEDQSLTRIIVDGMLIYIESDSSLITSLHSNPLPEGEGQDEGIDKTMSYF